MFPRLLVLVVWLPTLAITSADDIIVGPLENELEALHWTTEKQEKTKEKLRPLFENREWAVDEVYEYPFAKPDPNLQHQEKVPTEARKNMWDLLGKNGFNGGKNMGRIGSTEQKNLLKTMKMNGRLPSTLERVGQRIHSTPDGTNKEDSTKIKEDPQLAEQHSLIDNLKNSQQRISMALGKSQKAKITPGDAVGLKQVKNKSDNVLTEHLRPFKEEIFASLPKDGSYSVDKSELDGPVSESTESVIDYLELGENAKGSQKSVDLKGIIGDGFRMKERVQGKGKTQGDAKEAERKAEKILVGENGKMEERMRERERMKDGRWEKEREGERRIVENKNERGKRMIGGDIVMSGKEDGEKENNVMVEKVKEGEPIITARPSDVIQRMGEWENVGEGREGGVEEIQTLGDATMGRKGEQDKGMAENRRMEHGGQDGQVIVGQRNEMKERMKERERVSGDVKEREREGERVVTGKNRNMRERKHEALVGGPNHVMMRFQHQKEDWLPGWTIKGRSRGEAKGRKTGGGVQVEMQNERELEGHKMLYI